MEMEQWLKLIVSNHGILESSKNKIKICILLWSLLICNISHLPDHYFQCHELWGILYVTLSYYYTFFSFCLKYVVPCYCILQKIGSYFAKTVALFKGLALTNDKFNFCNKLYISSTLAPSLNCITNCTAKQSLWTKN